MIHHGLLICRRGVLLAEDLQLSSLGLQRRPAGEAQAEATPLQALETALSGLFQQQGDQLYERIEETVVRAAFEFCHRNQVQAARLLGISRNVLRARLIRHGDISAVR